jgi:hypothetical protein
MSIRKKVSIRLAIQAASEDSGGGDSRMRPLMMRWAVAAEEAIGSFTQYKRAYVYAPMVDVHRAELPCHVKAVMGLICGCPPEDETKIIFRGAHQYYQNLVNDNISLNHFMIAESGTYYQHTNPLWEIQDNHIVFLQPYSGKGVTVDALVMQVDADGYPLINENHVRAVAAGILWEKAKRTRFLPAEQRISPSDIRALEAEYKQLLRNARAEDAEPTTAERAEIVAMLNDPMSGCAGAVWRSPDEFYMI